MSDSIASAYASLYAELCGENLGRRPNGGHRVLIADSRSDRFAGIVKNAESLGVSPEKFIRGVIEEIRHLGIKPVHVFSVGQDIGLDLYKAYVKRIETMETITANTERYHANRDYQAEIQTELRSFRNVMERHLGRIFRGSFEQSWVRFMKSTLCWRLLDMVGDQGIMPPCFKLLWPQWKESGRSMPNVPEDYIKAVNTDESRRLMETLFPSKA